MRLSALALYQNQGNATYLYRNRCHLMHSVHKWLLTFSVTLIRLHPLWHTQMSLSEPCRSSRNLQSTLCDLKNLRSTLLDLKSLVPSSGAFWRLLVRHRSLGPTGQLLSQNQLDVITLLVPFQRLRVMCSTCFKQNPLRTC